MSLVYGLSASSAPNTNPVTLAGIKGSASLTKTLSLGGYYLVTDSRQGSGGRKFEYSLQGIEGAVRIPRNNGDVFVGLRAGLSKVRTSVSGQELIFSPTHYGLTVGSNFYWLSWLGFGFEGSLIRFQEDTTSSSSVTATEDTFDTISFLVSIQLRL